MRYPHPVTPSSITDPLASLISELVPGGVAEHVTVESAANAASDECFALVAAQVQSLGGASEYGWTLWELPGVFVEAEFHANWRRPDGQLIDVSPKRALIVRTLFLPDPIRTYEGRQVNNVRRATHSTPVLDEFFATYDAQFELLNRGERAWQHGEIKLSHGEHAEYQAIQMRQAVAQLALMPIWPSVTPYSQCICGSGTIVKRCHREFARSG